MLVRFPQRRVRHFMSCARQNPYMKCCGTGCKCWLGYNCTKGKLVCGTEQGCAHQGSKSGERTCGVSMA